MEEQAVEKTLNIVNEILIKAISVATETGEFLKGQIPDVVEQLLAWEFWSSFIPSMIWLVCFVVLLWFTLTRHIPWLVAKGKFAKLYPDGSKMDSDRWEYGPTLIVTIILLFIIVALFLSYGLGALKVIVAPKVFLLQYAAGLVK